MPANTQMYINLCRTPSTHLATLLDYARDNTAHFNRDMTVVTSDTSFTTHLCVIMSQCPLLATLLKSISPLMLDSPIIFLPQFSSSSVKNLLDLLYSGQCSINQDCGVVEIKQIIKAVGLNDMIGDLVKVKVEPEFSDMDIEASGSNTMPDTKENIKIDIELKEEVDVGEKIESVVLTEAADGLIEKESMDIVARTEERGEQDDGPGGGQFPTVDSEADGGLVQDRKEDKSKSRRMKQLLEGKKSDRKKKPVKYVVEEENKKVGSDKFGIVCEFCDIGLAGKKELKEHLGMGEGTSYRCKVKQEEEMVRMAGTGEREHVCQECGKGFKGKLVLTQHIKTVHREQKDYKCLECRREFGLKIILSVHIKTVHGGQKDHKCPECEREFGYKSHLSRHIKTVHREQKDYKCPECEREFGQKSNLIKHIKTVHGEQRDYK